jgi:hypothetical protein
MIKEIKQITVQDWDDLVKKTYGKIYSFQQQDGCKDRGIEVINTHDEYAEDFEATEINDEEMGVSFQTWLNTSPEDTAKHFSPQYSWDNELFWERNFYPEANMIAKDLFEKGLLPKGEYQIEIDW